jgi:hypothetical protein
LDYGEEGDAPMTLQGDGMWTGRPGGIGCLVALIGLVKWMVLWLIARLGRRG